MNKFSFIKNSGAIIFILIALQTSKVWANKILIQVPQTNTITGTIKDGTYPLPGVTILIKGKHKGTSSALNGNYEIIANQSDTLVFSFIGYKTIEIPVTKSKIDVQMIEDITNLKEVEINAGYYAVKDKERTGSITKVKAKEIEKQPVANPLAAMQARMTGVYITQETGTAGGGFNIRIRGTNSIRTEGNEPLYIVNGMPYASQSLGSTILISGILPNSNNPLNNINPADIESIEVLKDADATAIYGSRGSIK